jgi:hypothetical protein
MITRDYVRSIIGGTRSGVYRNVTRAAMRSSEFAVPNSRNGQQKENRIITLIITESKTEWEPSLQLIPPTFEYLFDRHT